MVAPVISPATVASSTVANEWFINTKFAVKGSGTTRSSAPGFADDPDLVLHVDASKTYELDFFAAINSPSAAGFNYTFTGSGGNVLYGTALSQAAAGTPVPVVSPAVYDGVTWLLNTTVTLSTYDFGVSQLLHITGILVTAGSAGNFTFRWSQATSNAGNTTVRAGSYMLMRRVS